MSIYRILVYLLVFVVVVAVISYFLIRTRKAVWEQFAKKYGFQIDEKDGQLSVHGEIQGRPLHLEITPESSDTGVLGMEDTCMSVEVRGSVPENFEVAPAPGVIGEVYRMLEVHRLEIGDDEFDDRVVVKGADRDEVLRYLTETRKQALLKLVEAEPTSTAGMKGSTVYIEDREMLTRLSLLENHMNLLLDVAGQLEEQHQATT